MGEPVEALLDANGEDGVILGAVYSEIDKPPFGNKDVRGTQYADGAEFSYNRASHTLTIRGGIEHMVIHVQTNVTIKAQALIIDAQSTNFIGNVNVDGDITSTGSIMDTKGNSNHHSH